MTVTTVDRDGVVAAASAVVDPELPALTLEMLGVLHEVHVNPRAHLRRVRWCPACQQPFEALRA